MRQQPYAVACISRKRVPNIALPTRILVAPQAIAASKSPDMPMDKRSSPLRLARSARVWKWGTGSTPAGGMHMRPVRASPNRRRISVMKAGAPASATPPFCGSAPVFTWINRRGQRPSRSAADAIASARAGRSRTSITSAAATASRALLVCSRPMMCRRTPVGRSANLSIASCTRFSPKCNRPAATAASTARRS